MAQASVDLSGLGRLIKHLKRVQHPTPGTLQLTTARIMEEDNRKGVLAGLDKDGVPMPPVKYRPKEAGRYATERQRNRGRARARIGVFGGLGPMAAGLNNNLTRREYERLGGPPLAPRRQHSRVITNYRQVPFEDGPRTFGVIGMWDQIASAGGKKFMHRHFDGSGKMPRRDLRGIRPDGRAKLRRAFIAWASDQIRYRKGR